MALEGGTCAAGAELDADAKKALERAAAHGRAPITEMTPDEARRAQSENRLLYEAPPPETCVDDFAIVSAIPLRRFRPLEAFEDEALPTLIYFHGGGWVTGDLDHGAWLCASLAKALRINVVSVGYRLAPEHPFPAAAEDAFASLDWIAEKGSEIGVDPERLAIGGDSAGGGLAGAGAIYARDKGVPLRAQILLYPVLDLAEEHSSYVRNGTGFGVTAEAMRWYRRHYLNGVDGRDWRASPIHADRVDGLAPALVVSCGFDVLCDEAVAYAERLSAAQVAVRHLHLEGQIHGFLGRSAIISEAHRTLAQIETVLAEALFEKPAGRI
jgi:acetyl esterase